MPRPVSVTILALAVLFLAIFNLVGAVSSAQRLSFLSSLPLSLPAVYGLVTRAAWGAVLAAMAVGLWKLWAWGRTGTLLAGSLYAAHSWFDRLLFSRSDFAQRTLPFALLLTLIGLALMWGILLRPGTRRYFSP